MARTIQGGKNLQLYAIVSMYLNETVFFMIRRAFFCKIDWLLARKDP